MKRISLTLICLLIVNILFAQVPQKFNYQAVLRSNTGQLQANKSIKIRLSFLSGSETGNSLYTEEHSVTTSELGIFKIEAGGSTNVILGNFSAIDWSLGNIWLKVEVDENLTGSFTSLGSTKLLSVPYALYAESGNQGPKGDTGNGISGIVDNGNGTLTINYTNGGSYLTPNLKGPQGEKGDQGAPGTGLVNKGDWVLGTTYNPGDYVFASNTQQTGNAMWIVKASAPFTSNTEPRNDLGNWIEFQAPQGPPGPLVSGTSGQTLRNNGTTWIANDNIFNDGTNVGIGIALPTQKLDINGAARFRGNIFDYDNLSGSNGQLLYKTANGIKWQSPTYANIGTNGTAGQLALWSNTTSLQGLSNLTWGTSLQVQSITTTDPDAPILEVKNSAGQVVFGVYQGGVRIYVDDSAVKGARGGFAVGGLSQTKAGTATEYFRITPDSARIYFKNSTVKGARGGFAVGGLSQTKATTSSEYLRITRDSARIYVNNPAKGARGGFAVGGLSQTKATSDNFMQLTPDNYFIGHQSGSSMTTGLYNNFFGYQTGMSNTVGNSNVFIGYLAGNLNSSGSNNVFLGNNSGRTNNADNNIFLGNEAGRFNNSGQNNAFVGVGAGYLNTTGSSNVFIGNLAGYSNTTGYSNIFLGPYCGYWGSGGAYNIFMGQESGYKNSTGMYNVFLGYQSGYANTEGERNIFIGVHAGEANTTGKGNVFMGDNSGLLNTTGDKNIFLGGDCGRGNISGSSNVFLGSSSGYSNTTGWENVFLGSSSGFNNTLGSSNVFLGSNSGKMNTEGWNNVFVGTYSGILNTTGNSNVFLGYYAGYTNNANNNVFIGNEAGRLNSSGAGNVFLGYLAGYTNNASNNVFLGTEAGKANTTGANNSFIGFLAGRSNTTGESNVFIGNTSGLSNTTGVSNVFIGNESGKNNTIGSQNQFIGINSGSNNSSGSYNVFMGPSSGLSNTSSQYNTFIGVSAGYYNTIYSFNTYLGCNAGFATNTGGANTYIGTNAGRLFEKGSNNTFVGTDAGEGGPGDTYNPGTTAISNNNTCFGTSAGNMIEGGDDNVYIGAFAGSSNILGSGNVFIGNYAGSSVSGDNKLFIANSSATPLIYGDFSSKLIGFGTILPLSNVHIEANALNQYGNLLVNRPSAGALGGTLVLRNATSTYIGNAAALSFELDGSTAFETNGVAAGNAEIRATIVASNGASNLQISNWNGGSINTGIVLASSGNVGIGKANPSTSLDVSGDATISGNIYGNLTGGVNGNVLGNLTGDVIGSVNGVTMGFIRMTESGNVITIGDESFTLYWDKTNGKFQITNYSGDWCDLWYRAQKGATAEGGTNSIANNSVKADIITGTNTDLNGFEIHFGQADGNDGWCSVWLQYCHGTLVGHYIKN